MEKIIDQLKALSDDKYREFNGRIVRTKKGMLGVRAPQLKQLAKNLSGKDKEELFNDLPNKYHELDMLAAYSINVEKDPQVQEERVRKLIKTTDNWAVGDSCVPKSLLKQKERMKALFTDLISSDDEFEVRFGIVCAMRAFRDEECEPAVTRQILSVDDDRYYVMMAKAWYLAEVMTVNPDEIIRIIESNLISDDLRRMTIRKALDSYRIPDEIKNELKRIR